MTPALYCCRWEPGGDVNLGEALIPPLIEAFGYRPVFFPEPPGAVANPGQCLLTIGSVLDACYLNKIIGAGLTPIAWGCGGWKDQRVTDQMIQKMGIRAVRGPLTREEFDLPSYVPLGDPAMLMALFYSMLPITKPDTYYVPHCLNMKKPPGREAIEQLGVTRMLSPKLTSGDRWVNMVFRLAMSSFVLTNSLHTAIVCQSYGTPWAFCLTEGEKHDKPQKWRDWFALLGFPLDAKPVRNLAEGLDWWNEIGSKSHFSTGSLGKLAEAFPYECLNPHTHKRVERCLNES